MELSREQAKEIARAYNLQRQQRVRANGAIFGNIAVHKSYAGEHVVWHDTQVTAFLDSTDPSHPKFDPVREVEEELLAIPPAVRAHILVVPNQPREHIARRLGTPITTSDVQETLTVLKKAEDLAKRMGIRNARVFVNSEDRLSVGYLHVHIIGEKTRPYSQPLAPSF